jgi:hypothetical protein
MTAAFGVGSHLVLVRIAQEQGLASPPVQGVVRTVSWSLVWVLYLLRSRRVRETFPAPRKLVAA